MKELEERIMNELEVMIDKEPAGFNENDLLKRHKDIYEKIKVLTIIDKDFLNKEFFSYNSPLHWLMSNHLDNQSEVSAENIGSYLSHFYKIIKFCIKNGSNLIVNDHIDGTLLHQAVLLSSNSYRDDIEYNNSLNDQTSYVEKIVELLLANKADPNIQNINGQTPLHLLIWREEHRDDCDIKQVEELMKLLVKKGADINKLDKCYNTPLHLILKGLITYKHFKEESFVAINSFIMYGADENIRNDQGETILDLICDLNNVKIQNSSSKDLVSLLTLKVNEYSNENSRLKNEIELLKNQLEKEGQKEPKRKKVVNEAIISDNNGKVSQVNQSSEINMATNLPRNQSSKQNQNPKDFSI